MEGIKEKGNKKSSSKKQVTSTYWFAGKNLSTIYDDGYGDEASDNDDYARTYINMTMVIMMIMQEPTLKRWWW